MDITRYKPALTSFMHLKSPDEEEPLFETLSTNPDEILKEAVGITFHSAGSPAYEAAVAKRTNRSLVRSKKKAELTADLLRADTVSFLTDVTVSFHHLDYPPAEGAIGEDLFRAVYADREYGWVVEQANAHLGDWSNFTKGSAKS
ncbi:hypothetical protein [Sphingomonas prati]|uniref:Uncharacterized protein n=1 Tax=Sphingomonas prati TaxID=1843237 RepID=A0A7W9BQJ6_9SPHN|nr:hypothetical protein [Sphingomonas prati]MBB5728265.1 hypothetical protein [Sphingomonas prati]GGE75142.1 hypothetical protein GCM10011404_04650 [Sphingomonas prati]